METRRTGGMTAIAVLSIIFGALEILNGLFQLLGRSPCCTNYCDKAFRDSALSCFLVPTIASIGTYDFASLSAGSVARLIIFILIYVGLPVAYSLLLCVVFYRPAWKTAFAAP